VVVRIDFWCFGGANYKSCSHFHPAIEGIESGSKAVPARHCHLVLPKDAFGFMLSEARYAFAGCKDPVICCTFTNLSGAILAAISFSSSIE